MVLNNVPRRLLYCYIVDLTSAESVENKLLHTVCQESLLKILFPTLVTIKGFLLEVKGPGVFAKLHNESTAKINQLKERLRNFKCRFYPSLMARVIFALVGKYLCQTQAISFCIELPGDS